jgi:predicted metal-dependent hydrolase
LAFETISLEENLEIRRLSHKRRKEENQYWQGLCSLQNAHSNVLNNIEAGQETNFWQSVPALQGSAVTEHHPLNQFTTKGGEKPYDYEF